MRSSRSAPDPLNPGPLGFAHRGLHGPGIPENSLDAFRAAAALGAGAECDVRLSHDAVPMVFHDPDLQRLCGRAARVDQQDSGWLAEQRLRGSSGRIPTLEQLLDRWPVHLPLLVECKSEGDNAAALAHAVAGAILEAERGATVAMMSFDPRVGAELARAVPEVRRGLVVDGRWSVSTRAAALDHSRAQFVAVDKLLLGDPWTAAVRDRMPVYCWTVNSRADRAQVGKFADAPIWEGDGRP